MGSKVASVTQNHVAQGAHLNTDVFLTDQVLEIWEQLQLEAMADSLGAQHDCVMEVLAIALMGLATVEEGWHWLLAARVCGLDDVNVLSGDKDIFGKVTDFRRVVLLINHVKSCDELSDSLVVSVGSLSDVLKHLVDVFFADNLETRYNQLELEMRRLLLKLVNDSSDNSQLLEKWQLLVVLVKEHARDVSKLDNKYVLVNASLESGGHQLLEKWNEFSELANLGKLVLEKLPNTMRVLFVSLFWAKKNDVFHLLVELLV
jgi:hypothetical protein